MRRLFLVLVLCATSHAATLERPVSDARIGLASSSMEGSVTGAFNGERFLVAWTSVDRGGQALVLDGTGEPVNLATGLPVRPFGVFWNGEVWIVVSYDGWVRVNANGLLLDQKPRALEGASNMLAMTWTGSALVVATRVYPPTFDPVLRIRVFDGQLRQQAMHDVDTKPDSERLASDGQTALLLYRRAGEPSPRPMHAMLFDANGTPLRSRTFSSANPLAVGTPGGGRGYRVVVGRAGTGPLRYTSYGLGYELGVTDAPSAYGEEALPSGTGRTLTWDGSAFTFFYGLSGVRIAEGGESLDDRKVVVDTDSYLASPVSAYGISGAGTTLMFYETTSGIYGTGLRYITMRKGRDLAGLAAAEERPLDEGAFQQTAPAAASSATQSLVAWRERLNSPLASSFVLATRVAANGDVLDPHSLILGNESCAEATPSITSDGSGFLAAWYDDEGVATALVRTDGTVAARTRVNRFRDAQCHPGAPKVISSGASYLVVWTRQKTYRDDVFAARIAADGTLLDTVPLPLGTTSVAIDGASDGRDYLLAWDGRYMRVGGNGVRLDPRIEASIGHDAGGEGTAVVWWNGSTYTLLQRKDVAYFSFRYQFVRVAANGTVVKTGDWLAPPASLWTWSGSTCSGNACTLVQGLPDNPSMLRELHVVDDEAHPSIAWGTSTPIAPVVTRPGFTSAVVAVPFRVAGGPLLAAYSRFALEQPYAGIARVFLRTMDVPRGRVVRH